MSKRDTNKQFFPYYTISQMKDILGYSHQGAKIFLLHSLNLPYDIIGNKYVFYIHEIKEAAPRLYSAILESMGLNRILSGQLDEEEEQVEQSNQFK